MPYTPELKRPYKCTSSGNLLREKTKEITVLRKISSSLEKVISAGHKFLIFSLNDINTEINTTCSARWPQLFDLRVHKAIRIKTNVWTFNADKSLYEVTKFKKVKDALAYEEKIKSGR